MTDQDFEGCIVDAPAFDLGEAKMQTLGNHFDEPEPVMGSRQIL